MGMELLALFMIPCGLVLGTGWLYIDWLRRLSLGQAIREEGPAHHQTKAGTPTGGGLLILIAVVLGLLTVNWMRHPLWWTEDITVVLIVTLALGLLGFSDDVLKIMKKQNKGVSGYTKLAIQALMGLALGGYILFTSQSSDITLFNWVRLDLPWWGYLLFSMFVVTATSNAVNLTDGLDGLAAGTAAFSFLALTFLFTNVIFPNTAWAYPDLAAISVAFVGALLGFLFYNAHPARMFMGDTGSLAIGGALAALALLGQVDFWLLLVGGVFVLEALSVILQVISFKLFKRRIFRMSPLHHHFELAGWTEEQVVFRFVGLQLLLCLVAVFLYNR